MRNSIFLDLNYFGTFLPNMVQAHMGIILLGEYNQI